VDHAELKGRHFTRGDGRVLAFWSPGHSATLEWSPRWRSGKENILFMLELRERAQGLVEYGLIIALVAVLAIAGLIIFGPAVSSLLSRVGGSV
jgi:hypothetical protein